MRYLVEATVSAVQASCGNLFHSHMIRSFPVYCRSHVLSLSDVKSTKTVITARTNGQKISPGNENKFTAAWVHLTTNPVMTNTLLLRQKFENIFKLVKSLVGVFNWEFIINYYSWKPQSDWNSEQPFRFGWNSSAVLTGRARLYPTQQHFTCSMTSVKHYFIKIRFWGRYSTKKYT